MESLNNQIIKQNLIIPKKQSDQIMVTWMQSSRNKLIKTYQPDGSKISNAKILAGRYQIYYLPNLFDLENFLKQFTAWDVLVLTVPQHMEGEISTLAQIKKGQAGHNLIARSGKYLEYINDRYHFQDYSSYYSLIGFDYDVAEYFEDKNLLQSPDEIRNMLIKLMPFLVSVGMLIRPSSSANICCVVSRIRLKPVNGYHIFFVVANSTKTNVQNMVEYFKRASWQNDCTFVIENKVGVTDKYLFDMSVYESARLWFETPAELSIMQVRETEKPSYYDGDILNLEAIDCNELEDYRTRLEQEKALLKKAQEVPNATKNSQKNNTNINLPTTVVPIQIIDTNTVVPVTTTTINKIVEIQKYLKFTRKHDVKEFHKLVDQNVAKVIIQFLGFEVDYNFKFKIRDEKTASCSIRDDGYIKDFGCTDIAGEIVNFLMKVYNLKFLESFNYLKSCFGIRYKLSNSTNKLPNPSGFIKILNRI